MAELGYVNLLLLVGILESAVVVTGTGGAEEWLVERLPAGIWGLGVASAACPAVTHSVIICSIKSSWSCEGWWVAVGIAHHCVVYNC